MANNAEKPTVELNKSLVERFGPMENDELNASRRSVVTEENAKDCFELISASFLDYAIEKWDLKNKL